MYLFIHNSTVKVIIPFFTSAFTKFKCNFFWKSIWIVVLELFLRSANYNFVVKWCFIGGLKHFQTCNIVQIHIINLESRHLSFSRIGYKEIS